MEFVVDGLSIIRFVFTEYSVIITSFYHGMNQKIKTKKEAYFQISVDSNVVFKFCMAMCVSMLPQTKC